MQEQWKGSPASRGLMRNLRVGVTGRPTPSLMALLVAGALAAIAAPQAAQAQPASGAQESRAQLNITAQPLLGALREFGRQTQHQVLFDESLVVGRQATAVSGRYTPREALERLLAGTGLEIATARTGAFSLKLTPSAPVALAPASSSAALAEVKVTAPIDRSGISEATGSYTARSTNTATKLALSPRETPQTLTVVTRQKMEDFSLDSVEEALESTSTIFIQRQGGDGAQYFSRGFRLQSQYDGMPNPLGIGEDNFSPSPDSAFLDRVEILQGAAGLTSGAGEPGGTINLVRKRPTEQFQAHAEAQFGSWNKRRLVGDISAPLIKSGKIRGRVVAFTDHRDSFTDYVFDNREGIYGIVEADLSDTTMLAASVTYQRNKFNNHYGVPMAPDGSDLGLPRSSFFGVSNGDSTRKNVNYTFNLDQRLAGNWRLRAAFTHARTDVDNVPSNLGGTLNVGTGAGLRIFSALQQRETDANVFDAYLTGPLEMFGRTHELAFGASASKLNYRNRMTDYVRNDININNFDRTSVTRPVGEFPDWTTGDTTQQQAMYGVARLNLTNSLKWILGGRVSWYEFKAEGVRDQKEDAVFTPYTGLVYDINQSYSLYASYSDIFKPQSSRTAQGSTVKPVVGRNFELGVKGEFMQKRLNLSAAVFKLEQTNLAEVDPSVPFDEGNICKGNCYTAAGLVVSKGIDLGVNGELAKGWQIGAGYTYVKSEYRTGDQSGMPYLSYAPNHILRAYTTYRIPGSGWTLGGSVRVQSKVFTRTEDFYIQQKAYAVVGIMAKYQINRQAEVGININNLFDRRYYDSVGSYSTKLENIYGAPRHIAVNFRYVF